MAEEQWLNGIFVGTGAALVHKSSSITCSALDPYFTTL